MMLVLDVEDWYANAREASEVADALLSADGEYLYAAEIVSAEWRSE